MACTSSTTRLGHAGKFDLGPSRNVLTEVKHNLPGILPYIRAERRNGNRIEKLILAEKWT